jgi:transposase
MTNNSRLSARLRVIQDAAGGFLTIKEAARLLGLSERQVQRLKQRWLRDSSDVLQHRNVGRSKPWKLPEDVRRRIVDYASTKYPKANDTQLHELLVTREKLIVSRESVRRILREAGLAPSPHRQPRRRLSSKRNLH